MKKSNQIQSVDWTRPAIPERVGVAMSEIAENMHEGIVKLFESGCGAGDVSGFSGEKVVADCIFHAAAAAVMSSQTAKRLVISVRHWGALIR